MALRRPLLTEGKGGQAAPGRACLRVPDSRDIELFIMLHPVKLLAFVAVVIQAPLARAQFDALARSAPDGANAILAIDVEAVLATPLASQQGWGKRLESAFVDRSVFLPPEARRVLHVSTLRPDRNFDSDSEVALMQLSRNPSLAAVARANGGRIEQLKGHDVVTGLGDAYLVPVTADVLAVYSPANRQLAAHWIASLPGKSSLTPFLRKALDRVGKEQQIVLALDLTDVISAADAALKLKSSKILDGSAHKPDAVGALVESLQGVAVDIAIGSEARATLHIDFGRPVDLPGPLMKRLVLKALDENGLKLDELENADFKVSGTSVTAKLGLSTGGLRRVMSLLAPPAPELPADSAGSPSKATSADTMATSSQAYFKTIVALLDDLRGDRSKQDPRGGMDAVWMDKYAQKIDRMSVLNVDQDLVDWGTKTAQTLRVMAGSRRGAGLSAGSQKSGLRTGAYVDSYYNVGVTSATATANDANQISVQTGNVATANRVEGWRLIDNATAELRKKETQRYGVDF
jgi:hypothetical protein